MPQLRTARVLITLATAAASMAVAAPVAESAPASNQASVKASVQASPPLVSPHASTMQTPRWTAASKRPTVVKHHVDINSAGRKELMRLPGIGAAEADKIIANRPYLTKTELVSKGVLPTGPFLALKYQVVAMQKLSAEQRKVLKASADPVSARKSLP